jgi:hypothetical protein
MAAAHHYVVGRQFARPCGGLADSTVEHEVHAEQIERHYRRADIAIGQHERSAPQVIMDPHRWPLTVCIPG